MSWFRVFTPHKATSERKLFYGWWIVAAGSFSQAYTSGAFWQGFGAFFDPIVEQFGWSRATTSAAVSIQRTESGAVAPFVGFFIDRFGPRKVMLGGIVATGLGFILLSRVDTLWQFYGAFLLLSLGMSFGTFLVVTTTVANWFVVQRTRALALMSAGSGLGGILVPLIVWLISSTDWRTGLVVVGVGFWVTGIPVAMVMRSRPEDFGSLPDGATRPQDTPAEAQGDPASPDTTSGPAATATAAVEANFTAMEALKTRSFWQMALALSAGQLVMSASVHQIPAMSSFGVSRETAGVVIMAVSLVGLGGRVTSGFLGDRIDKRRLIAGAFVSQFIGTLIFAGISNTWHLVGFVAFWGIGFGASIPVRFALLADYFGRRHFGSIMGIMMTVSTVFGIAGPTFVGWMADTRGNYREPYLLLALTIVVSIPLILGVKQPSRR